MRRFTIVYKYPLCGKCCRHSHKKRKDSLGVRAIYTEISLTSWNLPNSSKHWGWILRNMPSADEDLLLSRAFHAIIDKIEAYILQISKKWNWIKTFIHQGYYFRKIPAIKCQFCTKVCAPSGLVSEVWVKYKDVLTKILKRHARTNFI